jgi:membrane-bound serine protease (ClpP class)
MPEGWLWIIALLAIGYLLLAAELFVPGGILGTLGVVAVLWGCYLAFDQGVAWGAGAVLLSAAVTLVSVRAFFASRAGKRLVLGDVGSKSWKSSDEGLAHLVGQTGVTLSTLRPAGLAEIDGERIDVVSDSEFLDRGQRVTVVEVEGNRVVVAAAAEANASEGSAESEETDARDESEH